MELNTETIVTLLLAVVAAAVVVTKIVDGLKAQRALSDTNAGKINQIVSSIAALAVLLLTFYFQAEGRIPEAQEVGTLLAASPIIAYAITALAWLFHQGLKVVNGTAPKAIAA